MDYVRYIFRFLYKSRWWFILGTTLITLTVIYLTRHMIGKYRTEATLYTGIVSGYSIENNAKMDWGATQNAMDNLINIIRAESTLKRVSYHLFARVLIYGDATKDTHQITSACYNATYNHVKNSPDGRRILSLIDKSSEDKTVENLIKYAKPDKQNYIYGLFYYNHPFYSYNALKGIAIQRKGNSDLLEISYESSDPGIAYNTIEILTKEFVSEYQLIRYGETDKVIAYFKSELDRIGSELRNNEDDLTKYNIDKRIINYTDETKEIAAINKEFELREQDILFAYNSSRAMLAALESRMDQNMKQAVNSANLLSKLKEASNIANKITELETVNSRHAEDDSSLDLYKTKLSKARKELTAISNHYIENQYTKEGVTKQSILEQWLDQTLLFEKAKAELDIIRDSRTELDGKYVFYAPVGSTIKRKERVINFNEQNYLATLQSYNEALMRRKSLEMTSASLRVLNEPAYPINSEKSARRKIIITTFFGSFLFILGLLLLIELFDRTLRDVTRTQKLTGLKVIGAFPDMSPLFKLSGKTIVVKASKYLSLSILRFFIKRDPDMPYVVNLLSTEKGTGKSYIAILLESLWTEKGLNVRYLSWEKDFDTESRSFALAKSIKDLCGYSNEDIYIIEHQAINKNNIPNALLQEANINLLVVSASLGWKDTDCILLDSLKAQTAEAPLYIYLNQASKDVTEVFTGMLPPYTPYRRIVYRISQLALTEKRQRFTFRSTKKKI